MWNSVVHCLRNYANFAGRAARPEYWWFYLFLILVNIPIYALADFSPRIGIWLTWLWGLLPLLPFLAVMSRRLHDTGHSFWWAGAPFLAMCALGLEEIFSPRLLKTPGPAVFLNLALALLFLVLGVRCLILLCSRGEAAANRYGPPPAPLG